VKPHLKDLRGRIGAAVVVGLLAGCAAVPPPQPAPAPLPRPAPAPTPTPTPAPVSTASWEEAPVAQGDWHYERIGDAGTARFTLVDGLMPRNAVTLTCDRPRQQIILSVRGTGGNASVVIRTTFGAVAWNGSARTATGGDSWIDMPRPAGDQGFDWMGFSRGRIAIEAPGQARLVIPAWAEIGRVVEDCRN
jgi:hypothetical protein